MITRGWGLEACYLGLVEEGRVEPIPVKCPASSTLRTPCRRVAATLPLEQAAAALRLAESRTVAGKVVLQA